MTVSEIFRMFLNEVQFQCSSDDNSNPTNIEGRQNYSQADMVYLLSISM